MTSNDPMADPARCPLCGRPNHCPLAAGGPRTAPCWCWQVEFPAALLARVPVPLRNRACICQACYLAFQREEQAAENGVRAAPGCSSAVGAAIPSAAGASR